MLTALEFFKTKHRMCNTPDSCIDCPIYSKKARRQWCSAWINTHPEEAISIVEQWGKEHPVKTIASDFFEKYPNAPRINDVPDLCIMDIGIKPHIHDCIGDPIECEMCWNRPLEEVNK